MTVTKRKKNISQLIDKEWCKGCGICVHFCPKDVLELDRHGKAEAVRPEDCIACKLCELRCPDLAIQISVDQKSEEREGENEKQE